MLRCVLMRETIYRSIYVILIRYIPLNVDLSRFLKGSVKIYLLGVSVAFLYSVTPAMHAGFIVHVSLLLNCFNARVMFKQLINKKLMT